MTRIKPKEDLRESACSIVGIWTAYKELWESVEGNISKNDFFSSMYDFEKTVKNNNGYCSLRNYNRQVRKLFKVEKYEYFKRSERVTLRKYAETTSAKCLVCVLGHFLYADFSQKNTGHSSTTLMMLLWRCGG